MGKHQGMEGIKRIKFQLNISKIMPARPKTHRDMDMNTNITSKFKN